MAVTIDGKTSGHIPKNLSNTFKRFLTLPNCTIEKRVNHSAGYGLEILVNLNFLDQPKQFSGHKTL